MAIAYITGTSVGGNSGGGTTGSVTTTGANLIVLVAASYALSGEPTVSDSKSNTYTALTARTGTQTRLRIFYCSAPTVGSGHTFTVSGAASYSSLVAMSFSGAAASPSDLETGTSTTSGVTSLAVGSLTPSQGNCLVIAGLNHLGTSPTINSGFTSVSPVDYSAAVHFGVGGAYLIQTSASAVNPTWSWTGANEASVASASFKSNVPAIRRRRIFSFA